jgi:diadenosine tetraphosphate (Ap4A) HIT family hydrolase
MGSAAVRPHGPAEAAAPARVPFDLAAYRATVHGQPCFICALANHEPGPRAAHELIYEDAWSLVFLNRYPTLYGQTLVCPREHREDPTADFSEDEYVRLQRLVYRVAQAVRHAVPTERMYVLSLGSEQGIRHVHWHIAPLPPGTPRDEQELAALDCRRGILAPSPWASAALGQRIRERLPVD